jgi:hypothetical protein
MYLHVQAEKKEISAKVQQESMNAMQGLLRAPK